MPPKRKIKHLQGSCGEIFSSPVCNFAHLFRHSVSDPLQVGRVSLINGQADDLGHFIRMIRPAEKDQLCDHLPHLSHVMPEDNYCM